LLRATHLPEEVEEGPVEYKLKLVKPPAERVRHLTTQMHWRQTNGAGTMFYRLGYHDDGYPRGVTPAQMAGTLRVVCGMAAKAGASYSVVEDSVLVGWGPSPSEQDKSDKAKSAIEASWKAGTWGRGFGGVASKGGETEAGVPWAEPAGHTGETESHERPLGADVAEGASAAGAASGEVGASPGTPSSRGSEWRSEETDPSLGVKEFGAEHLCLTLRVTGRQGHGRASWEELRVAVLGDEAAGKSTLVSVLTQGGLDDGQGLKRIEVFRHFHEVEAGRTSAISEQILGFDKDGGVVDGNGREVDVYHAAAQGPAASGQWAQSAGEQGPETSSQRAPVMPPTVPVVPAAAVSEEMADPFSAGKPTQGSASEASPGSQSSSPPPSRGHRAARSSSMVRQEHVTVPSWRELVAICSGGRVVVFCDTGGHERYARTAMLSLLGRAPDVALLVVDATKGLTRRAKERLGVVLALRLPVAVVVAKSDVVSRSRARRSVNSVMNLLRSHGVGRRALLVNPGGHNAATASAAASAAAASSAGGLGREVSATSTASSGSDMPSSLQSGTVPRTPDPPAGDAAATRASVLGSGQPGRSVSTGDGSEDGRAASPTRQPPMGLAAAATVPGSSAAHLEELAGADAAERCVSAAASGFGWPVPVFVASNVTGEGLRSIRTFLQRVPKQRSWAEAARKEALVLLHAAWDVEGLTKGLVVSGVVAQGKIAVGDGMLLGPDGLGRFTRATVSSVHSLRVPVGSVEAGRSASFALQSIVPAPSPSASAAYAGAPASAAVSLSGASKPSVADSLWAAAAGAGVGMGGDDDGEMAGLGMGLLGADSDSEEMAMMDEDDDDDDADSAKAAGDEEERDERGDQRGEAERPTAQATEPMAAAAGGSDSPQPLRREAYRKGMVLAASGLGARACRRFEVELIVLRHPTALRRGAAVHILVRTVRQTAVVESVEPLLDEEAPAVAEQAEPQRGSQAARAWGHPAAGTASATASAAAAASAVTGDPSASGGEMAAVSSSTDSGAAGPEVSLDVAMADSLRSVSAPIPTAVAVDRAATIRSIVQRNRLRMGARTGDRCVVRLRWQHRPEYVSEGAAVLVRDGQIRAVGRVLSVGGHSLLVRRGAGAGGAAGEAAADGVAPHTPSRRSLRPTGASVGSLHSLVAPATADAGRGRRQRAGSTRRRQSWGRSEAVLE
jgi:GTPase